MARILVVDDDATARELVRLHLEARGHSVVLAGDGEHALCVLERRSAHEECGGDEGPGGVDVVVSDVEMPVMDGLELLEVLRSHPDLSEMPVIFLTARSADIAVRDAVSASVVRALPKPADIRALLREIELALRTGNRSGIYAAEPPSLNAG